MKKILFLLLASSLCAQTVIGPNSSTTVSNKNILKLQDGDKGAVFTNTTKYTTFPKYNITDSPDDLFDDLPNMEGSILYNKDDDQYYKYDGFAWNPARQLQGRFNFKTSRLGLSNPVGFVCGTFAGVAACVDPGLSNTMVYGGSVADNKNQLIVDSGYLNIKSASNGVQIVENGLYEVGSSLGFTGLGLAAGAGIVEFRLSLQVDYGSGWIDLADKSNYSLVLIADLGATKTTSFTHTITLPSAAKLRCVANIKLYIASAGGGSIYTAQSDPVYSYLTVRQIKKY